jgi:hypothetical protein
MCGATRDVRANSGHCEVDLFKKKDRLVTVSPKRQPLFIVTPISAAKIYDRNGEPSHSDVRIRARPLDHAGEPGDGEGCAALRR